MDSRKIFVIDDDATTRAFLRASLHAHGYATLEADSGLDVLSSIEQHAPDLIITDLFMDKQEGLQTILQIREQDNELPIIAISGNRQYLDIALEMGADSMLQKPIDVAELLSKLDELIPAEPPRVE